MNLKPGDYTTVDANQGDRDATVLAVIGDQVLVEYTMPAGSTALQILTEDGRGQSVTYRTIPTKWLQAIVDADQDWEGRPQQTGSWRPAAPAVMLKARATRDGFARATYGFGFGQGRVL